jgi:TolB protein
MDTQFSELTRVTVADRDDIWPAWSPDGTRIAMVSNRDFNRELYVANADGSGQARLTNDPGVEGAPAWSPDGTLVAFSSFRDGRRDIYVIQPDGRALVRLTNDTEEQAAAVYRIMPD